VKKDKIEVNIHTFTDADGNVVYDFESIAEEFEDKLTEFDQSVLVMCSIQDVADVDRFRLEMEELKAKQNISNRRKDGTIALA